MIAPPSNKNTPPAPVLERLPRKSERTSCSIRGLYKIIFYEAVFYGAKMGRFVFGSLQRTLTFPLHIFSALRALLTDS